MPLPTTRSLPRLGLATALATLALLSGPASPVVTAQNEIDRFMEQVLARRDENRAARLDYVLDERETLEIVAGGRTPMGGFDREYTWYARDGYLIRSPVRFDGVGIDEAERRRFEEDWLRQERRRVDGPRRPRRRRSRRGSFENIMITVERDWGSRIDEALGRSLAAEAERRGDDFAVVVLATDRIAADLGGVEAVGFEVAADRTRDVFVMLESGRVDDPEAVPVLAAMLPRLGAALDPGAAGSTRIVELVRLVDRFGLATPSLAAALDDTGAHLRARGLEEAARVVDRVRRVAERRRDAADGTGPTDGAEAPPDLQPRFVSEAFFLDFAFEPGRYLFAGRDRIEDREVVVIEYYPEQMFSDESATVTSEDREDRIEAGFDRTSLVTLWVDPEIHQIVRFTFDNVGFDFLPGRWLARLEDLTASMVMGQPFDGVWLPQAVRLDGRIMLATGPVELRYERAFSNYRRADVRSRIQRYETPGTPQR